MRLVAALRAQDLRVVLDRGVGEQPLGDVVVEARSTRGRRRGARSRSACSARGPAARGRRGPGRCCRRPGAAARTSRRASTSTRSAPARRPPRSAPPPRAHPACRDTAHGTPARRRASPRARTRSGDRRGRRRDRRDSTRRASAPVVIVLMPRTYRSSIPCGAPYSASSVEERPAAGTPPARARPIPSHLAAREQLERDDRVERRLEHDGLMAPLAHRVLVVEHVVEVGRPRLPVLARTRDVGAGARLAAHPVAERRRIGQRGGDDVARRHLRRRARSPAPSSRARACAASAGRR